MIKWASSQVQVWLNVPNIFGNKNFCGQFIIEYRQVVHRLTRFNAAHIMPKIRDLNVYFSKILF